MRRMRAPLLFLTLAALGCSPIEPDAAREAWLWSTLRDDARPYIERDPGLAAARFALMDSDAYTFLRGTLGQYLRDAREGGPAFPPSAFGGGAAAEVLLFGDPHLENLGTFRDARGSLRLDFNDFDAAMYGPYPWDVRRMALSVEIALRLSGIQGTQAAVRAVAEGYVAEIGALSTGQPASVATPEASVIVGWLFEKATEEGGAREELADYTTVTDGRRRLLRGQLSPPERGLVVRALAELSWAERRLLDAALADYASATGRPLAALRPLDAARRLGAGVASYASFRYYVLLDGETGALDDDVLLELKEAPPQRVGAPARAIGAHPYSDEATRVVASTRALQSSPDNDPWLGVARVTPQTFRVRNRTAWQKGLDRMKLDEKLTDGKWTPADVVHLARIAGRLLARGHALAPGRRGIPGLAALAADLNGRETGFVQESTGFALAYADVLERDAETLHRLIETEGPLLGAAP